MSNQEKSGHQEIEVPSNVLVECPLVGKKLQPISKCLSCQHYAAMLDRFPGAVHLSFSKRFMVGCKYPFGRALFEIAESNDGDT
jgi:hypothetical protein